MRHHRVPRRILFTPNCATDCPKDVSLIAGSRTTYMYLLPRKRGERVLRDDWKKAGVPNRDMEQLWTGRTVFKIEVKQQAPKKDAPDDVWDVLSREDFPNYDGDIWPSHWDQTKKDEMQVAYQAIPEEFYTKTGRRPITPANVSSWLRASSKRGLRFQFWELCAGSGRLSLILLTASMVVGFPVDYRYGWDLAHPPHQELIRECQVALQPAHIFAAPTCRPWSVASSSKTPALRAAERACELPTLEFLYEAMLYQHNSNLGFTLEQPYGSAMLSDSPVARLRDIGGVRVWRLDQCMLGAQDERGAPVRKATALLSNRRFKMVIKRCDSHRGKPHGVLQGKVCGVNRTAMAAVCPKRLCQLLGQDIWTSLRRDAAASCKPWPQQLFWLHGIYYGCERCQLGRAAPPGCEHTLVPGQCRYGQPGMRRARPPVGPDAPPASPTTTTSPAEAPVPTGTPQRSDLEDVTGPFKFLARNGDYSKIALRCDSSLQLSSENCLYLKAALLQMLRTCIDIFNENTTVDYDHWLEDPVLLKVFQEIFEPHFSVLGVMCSLRPWRRKIPDPYLSSSCAPMRLLIQGNMRQWNVFALEDMRLLSHNQLHEPLGESDWNFHLFGVRPNNASADLVPAGCGDARDGDPDGPHGSSSRARPRSAASRPAAPLAPSEKENGGRNADDAQRPLPQLHPPQMEEAEAEGEAEEDFDAVRQEQEPETLKPLFDFKKVFKRLQSGLISSDPVTAKRLLLGLQ